MTSLNLRLLTVIGLLLVFGLLVLSCSDDDNPVKPNPTWQWSAMGEGVNDRVFAMIEYDGQLVVAGFFDSAGGIAANNIAVWNDTTWSTMGSGMDGEVCALTIHEGQLIAGGLFTTAGGNPASNLAVWDGISWSEFNSGTNGKVRALGSHHVTSLNKKWLLVGGEFTQAGGTNSTNFTIWIDDQWHTYNADGPVYAISSDSNYSFIGGHYDILGCGNKSLSYMYDNSFYCGVSDISDADTLGTVYALTNIKNTVYFGGLFDEADSISTKNIGMNSGDETNWWNLWDSLGSGTSGGPVTSPVHALTQFNGNIIAGGYFRAAGGVTANHVASWNGSTWRALGSGVDGAFWPHVWALTTYNGKLIAGGRFTTAGGIEANNIAMWELK